MTEPGDDDATSVVPLLRVNDAKFLVDGEVSLEPISFVTKGERVIVAGDYRPLLRVLLGGATPTTLGGSACVASGALEVAGVDLGAGLSPRVLGVALTDAPLPDGFTVLRYLAASGRLAGVGSREADVLAARVLDLVGASRLAERMTARLTLAERRLVGLAHAVLLDPPVVLLEEPLAGLEGGGLELVRHAIGVVTTGRAAIVCLARMWLEGPSADFLRDATHVVSLAEGRIVFDGEASALFAGARRFAVTAVGAVAAFRDALQTLGATLHGTDDKLAVTLPEGLGAKAIVSAAARTGTGLLGCAPIV